MSQNQFQTTTGQTLIIRVANSIIFHECKVCRDQAKQAILINQFFMTYKHQNFFMKTFCFSTTLNVAHYISVYGANIMYN